LNLRTYSFTDKHKIWNSLLKNGWIRTDWMNV